MVMEVSERRVCRVAGQHRSTRRRTAPTYPYRHRLVARLRELALDHPRQGRRHVMDLLHKQRRSAAARLMKSLWRQGALLVTPYVSMMMRHSPSLQTIRATRSVHHAERPVFQARFRP